MTISDWIAILAVLIAPVVAVQVQKLIERMRERRAKKLNVFQILMSTRATRLSVVHVQALNMIDFEFCGRKVLGFRHTSSTEKTVLDAWKEYHDLLCDSQEPDPARLRKRRDDAFIDLLYAMSRDLRYDFDKVQLRKGIYFPQAHGDLELDQFIIRKSLVEIMDGKRQIPIQVVRGPAGKVEPSEQKSVKAESSGDS